MTNRALLLDVLNADERAELARLRERYFEARAAKNYELSDRLRTELEARGTRGPDYAAWHPQFESAQQRQARAAARYLFAP